MIYSNRLHCLKTCYNTSRVERQSFAVSGSKELTKLYNLHLFITLGCEPHISTYFKHIYTYFYIFSCIFLLISTYLPHISTYFHVYFYIISCIFLLISTYIYLYLPHISTYFKHIYTYFHVYFYLFLHIYCYFLHVEHYIYHYLPRQIVTNIRQSVAKSNKIYLYSICSDTKVWCFHRIHNKTPHCCN